MERKEDWKTFKKIPAWNLAKVRNKSEVINEARNKDITVQFASLMDMLNYRRNIRNTKVELYSEVISGATIQTLMQYSQNKDHQHHK